jgi:glycosyltransferase involved in cell wall biosynthesis
MTADHKRSSTISVVMPLYNGVHDVLRAVGSVLHQRVSDFELIVVNDGSTDGGEKIVRDLKDGRIRVVDQENKGVSAARNRGVAEAKGELIAFLDADDEWKPNFLETIERLHRVFSACAVFATQYVYRELDGSTRHPILHRVPQGEWEGVLEHYFDVAAHSDPPLWSSAIVVKKSALLSIGGFPEGIAIGEDLLTWARLAVYYQIAYSKKQCAEFWLRGSLTGFPTRKPEVPDKVGDQLAQLLPHIHSDQQMDFRRYAAMWHRMRASMFVQLEDSNRALQEVRKIRLYSRMDLHATLYFFLAMTPRMIRKFVLQIFTFIRTLRRRIS